MANIWTVLMTPEFWMAMSVVALAIPGPQTRLLPALLRALAQALAAAKPPKGEA